MASGKWRDQKQGGKLYPLQNHSHVTTKGTSNPYRSPFQIGMDLFFCKRKWYLLVSDYYSKFSIFRLLPSVFSKNLIYALESIISEYGNAEKIIYDDGKTFIAQEYMNVATQ